MYLSRWTRKQLLLMSTKWGNCFKSSFKPSHPSLELVPRSSNNPDSRVYPRSQQFDSGLGVQKFSGQDQLEIESSEFQTITGVVGSCNVDLFADKTNYQLKRYFSWKPNLHAKSFDAFIQDWRTIKRYAFPPFCLIGPCMSKIREEQSEILIITPTWQSQS